MPVFLANYLGIGFVLLVLMLIIANFVGRRPFLFLSGFVIPLAMVQPSVGINLFLFALVGPLSLVLLPFASYRNLPRMQVREFWLFVSYSLLLTAVWMILELTILERYQLAEYLDIGPAQAKYRFPVQILSFLMQSLAFTIVPTRAKNKSDVKSAANGYIAGCVFSLIFGAVVLVLGLPVVHNVEFSSQEHEFVRLSGLSGEPKHLASFLVIGLFYLLAQYRANRSNGILLFVFAVAIFMTFSTSGWMGALFGLLVYLILGSPKPVKHVTTKLIMGAGMVTLAMSLLMGGMLGDLFSQRFTDRFLDDEAADVDAQKEAIVWHVYQDSPMYLPIGYGLGGADLEGLPFLFSEKTLNTYLDRRIIPTASVSAVRLLGDIGLIGIFLLWVLVWRTRTKLNNRQQHLWATFLLPGLAGFSLCAYTANTGFLFLLGAATSAVSMSTKAKR